MLARAGAHSILTGSRESCSCQYSIFSLSLSLSLGICVPTDFLTGCPAVVDSCLRSSFIYAINFYLDTLYSFCSLLLGSSPTPFDRLRSLVLISTRILQFSSHYARSFLDLLESSLTFFDAIRSLSFVATRILSAIVRVPTLVPLYIYPNPPWHFSRLHTLAHPHTDSDPLWQFIRFAKLVLVIEARILSGIFFSIRSLVLTSTRILSDIFDS